MASDSGGPLALIIDKLNAADPEQLQQPDHDAGAGLDPPQDLRWAATLADELLALSSIYDEEAITLLPLSHSQNGHASAAAGSSSSSSGTERSATPERDVQLALAHSWRPGMRLRLAIRSQLEGGAASGASDDEPVELRIAATLPERYPDTPKPPQLQLLNRFVGAHAVDHVLFGRVLRCLLHDPSQQQMQHTQQQHVESGVAWRRGESVLFEALDWVRETVQVWYEGKQRELAQRAVAQEIERSNGMGGSSSRSGEVAATTSTAQHSIPVNGAAAEGPGRTDFAAAPPEGTAAARPSPEELAALAKKLGLVSAEPIVERKSTFIGHACRLENPDQVPRIIEHLRSDKRIARAHHPTIYAYVCTTPDGVTHRDCDDDGESAAGGRLAHLLQILELDHVLVVVTRAFGGTLLGPDRFKFINRAARDALQLGGHVSK